VLLTCHSYVTVYIYPRYSHLKSLASYFGLQISRTHPHVYYSFLLQTSAIQSLKQTINVDSVSGPSGWTVIFIKLWEPVLKWVGTHSSESFDTGTVYPGKPASKLGMFSGVLVNHVRWLHCTRLVDRPDSTV